MVQRRMSSRRRRQGRFSVFGNQTSLLRYFILCLLMILCYRQLLLSDHVVVSDGSSMQVGLLDDAQKSSSAGAATRKPLVGPPVNGSTLAIETIPKLLERGASPENITPVPVVVWPLWEFGPGNAEARHVEQDGIDESPYLRMTNVSDYDPNVVWVGDAGYAYGSHVWCEKFQQHIIRARMERAKQGLPITWPIFIVDFSDYPKQQRCGGIEYLLNSNDNHMVRYAQRAAVQGRRWDNSTQWVSVGQSLTLTFPDVTYYRTPLVVRTDTVEALQRVLALSGFQLTDAIERVLDRPVDVRHLWPQDGYGVGIVHSNLRERVNGILLDMQQRESDWNIQVGLAGMAAQQGRRDVSLEYIRALLNTKIVVVTQRDEWEDHYRLFEALVAGPLVLTDRMLSLPQGILNGTSIVEFESEDDLRHKIKHYLEHEDERIEIARQGRFVAMLMHRSWHRMEQIIFGRELTVCSMYSSSKATCPFVVHARDMYT